MHNLRMQMQPSPAEIALARSKLKSLGLSQSRLASLLKVSQSQISRILSGQTSPASKLAKDICIYVSSSAASIDRTSIATNNELMDALSAVWDGTPAHARALAVVIRSLEVLRPETARRGRT